MKYVNISVCYLIQEIASWAVLGQRADCLAYSDFVAVVSAFGNYSL